MLVDLSPEYHTFIDSLTRRKAVYTSALPYHATGGSDEEVISEQPTASPAAGAWPHGAGGASGEPCSTNSSSRGPAKVYLMLFFEPQAWSEEGESGMFGRKSASPATSMTLDSQTQPRA